MEQPGKLGKQPECGGCWTGQRVLSIPLELLVQRGALQQSCVQAQPQETCIALWLGEGHGTEVSLLPSWAPKPGHIKVRRHLHVLPQGPGPPEDQ